MVASSTVPGFAAVFESAGNLPDTTTFDNSASIAGQTTQAVEFFAPGPGVLCFGAGNLGSRFGDIVHDHRSAGGSQLTGRRRDLRQQRREVTVPIFGSFFQTGLQASLVASNNTAQAAVSVLVRSSTQAYATFDLAKLAIGAYSVKVSVAGRSATLHSAFSVVAGTAGQFQAQVSFPNGTASGGAGPVQGVITYSNTGGTDLIAPLLVLDGNGQAGLRLDASEPFERSAPARGRQLLRAGRRAAAG